MLAPMMRPDGQSVVHLAHYPTAHPDHSQPLSLTRRREILSAVDVAADQCVRHSRLLQDRYPEHEVLLKEVAIRVIDSAWIATLNSLAEFLFSEEQQPLIDIFNRLKRIQIEQLPQLPKTRKVYQVVAHLLISWVKECQLVNRHVTMQPPFQPPAVDFQLARANYESYRDNLCVPLCQDFAFYKLNEEQAFPHLFNADCTPWPIELALSPGQFLNRWGYQLIEKPMPGDLVCYCSTLKGTLEAKHWGLWTPNEKVLSKGGLIDPLEHPLEDVIVSFGNFVYFFRKQIRSALLKNFLTEVEKQGTIASQDPQTCLQKITQILDSLPMPRVFVGSIFNLQYNQELKQKIGEKLVQFSKIVKAETKIETLVGIVKSISLKASFEVTPKF
jgi:hypothetical protein